ncbi:methyltransferase domain-containing protein [Desulfococcaceae bacterium HSG7]|nr:methyltransferase domain-containing protein [Desulfococcaceae bacterium HSG7]
MKISGYIKRNLLCPCTKGKLQQNGDHLESVIDSSIRYPIIDGIPILINNANSLFSVDDFINRKNTTFDLQQHPLRKILKRFLPSISANIKAKDNYTKPASLLSRNSTILVIGGSIKGEGMEAIYTNESFEIVGSDVSFGPYTTLISDAHNIPFENETFDCVVIQAVLEHVLNPQRCIREVHRVLKPHGFVYAETPFMEQVHGQQYDFTRFTHLGHRWLFRNFEEIMSGPCCGPGMALA